MDLLRDKKYVPETDHVGNELIHDIESLFDQLADIVTDSSADYDFMDLLNDKGYVPAQNSWTQFASNDNSVILQAVS